MESNWKKDSGEKGYFLHSAGNWYGDAERDLGIQTSEDNRFYTIATKFPKAFDNKGKTLVFQYQVKFQQGIDCGGGYVKIANDQMDPAEFKGGEGETPYHVMFGPDICGSNRIHLIFANRGVNHLWKKNVPAENDKFSHLYRFVLNPDNTYSVSVDGKEKASGSLFEDWDIIPPKTIPDPDSKKPEDWVDQTEIEDPEDKKPENWDSIPENIDDPEAKKPEDWDEDDEGEWTPPQIKNPDFKGEWKPKKIPNPAYKGPWKAPEIANPNHFEDDTIYSYKNWGGLAIEVWQVKAGTHFDNIFMSDSVEEADAFKKETFDVMLEGEKKMHDEKQKEEQDAAKAAEEEKKKAEEAKADDAKPAEEKGDDL